MGETYQWNIFLLLNFAPTDLRAKARSCLEIGFCVNSCHDYIDYTLISGTGVKKLRIVLILRERKKKESLLRY